MSTDKETPDAAFLTNREMISDMHSKTTKMYNLMYGDKDAGILGVSHRVTELEKSDKKRTGIYAMISAISAGLALGIKSLADHLK